MITTSLWIKSLFRLYLLMLLMTGQTLAFIASWSTSKTHQDITDNAILQTTADVCRSHLLRFQQEQNFTWPDPLTVESVSEACLSPDSAKKFQISINEINHYNAWVNFWRFFSAGYHFHNEEFTSGQNLITEGAFAVKFSVKHQSYQAAREALGKLLHTLQDFYSHSNWIELGMTEPYSTLIKPDTTINNIAESQTCRICEGEKCRGKILEDIIIHHKLTSGYFDWSTPEGKCSHGGLLLFDQGGINKDETSSNGHLHDTAASVATYATKELLQDIRSAIGDSEYLRLMGLSQSSVLCFVVDTSMPDVINDVKRVILSIVDSKSATEAQVSEYILVPVNGSDCGPLTRTINPNEFKWHLNALTPVEGEDSPKMSLTALQIALTRSPPNTEIFVFTYDDAKDKWLMSTVRALIEKSKSVVSFILTKGSYSWHEKMSAKPQQVSTWPSTSLYHYLAQVSGGLAIELTSGTLPVSTDIIAFNSKSTLVTLFNAVRNPAKAENFSVFVDSSVQNLTIYITGDCLDYIITSPSGVSMKSNELTTTLGFIQKVGNFHTVHPITAMAGLWSININSTEYYTIRVVGQSMVDFLFDFIVEKPNLSYAVLNRRPAANSSVTLLVTMVGGDSVKPTEVSLVEASGLNYLKRTLEEVASGQYLATFKTLPAGDFTVCVNGHIDSSKSSDNIFQRQSPTHFQASGVTVMTQDVGTVEPGAQFMFPYTVTTSNSGGRFNITVSNDHNFETLFNSSITIVGDNSANDMVTVIAPEDISSGMVVTVIIQAEAFDGSDSNYAVLHLAVIAPVKDFTPPLFDTVSVNVDCSGSHSLFTWYLTANVTDGNGTGVDSVRVLQGSGNLSTTTVLSDTGVNVTMISYISSCSSLNLKLVATDAVGNVATHLQSVEDFTPPLFEGVTVTADCSGNCSVSTWYLTANITDGDGTGVKSVRVVQGNGSLSTTTEVSDTGVNVTMIMYNSSCCSSELELVAEDEVGNVATCFQSVRATAPTTSNAPPATSTETNTITMDATATSTAHPTNHASAHTPVQASSNAIECCILSVFLCFNIGVSFHQFL